MFLQTVCKRVFVTLLPKKKAKLMKAKLSLSLVASLLMAGSAFAAGNIVGAVYDKGTAKPLDYASVVLVSPTTGAPLSIGTMTDESGKFVITTHLRENTLSV